MSLLNSFFNFLREVIYQNKHLNSLILLFIDWFLITLKISKSNKKQSEDDEDDSSIVNADWEKRLLINGIAFHYLDLIFLYSLSTCFKFTKNFKTTSYSEDKVKQFSNSGFYMFNNQNSIFSKSQLYLYGIRSFWKAIRFWLLPITLGLLFVYYSFFLKSLPFSKIFFGYLLVGNMFYLLISGFVFFIKKYQYRLYTSVIQRFWRRTLFIFWAIEGSLFTVFVYLIFNASQEPVYVYDNIQIYKTHFYSWRYFLIKIILSTIIILLTYILLLSIKWNTFTKTNNIAFLITVLLLYVAWLEFYQLFHLMNCYGTSYWVYDFTEHLWNLELEFKRTRIVNHYVTIGLVAKFWHIVFAVIFWIFFILRGVESSRYRYPLLAANLQNFLIIYIMSWLYMYPWFKYVLRKSLDMPYFWFFVNNRKLGVFLFFNDIKLYYWGFLDLFKSLFNLDSFKSNSFFYWYESSSSLGNTQFRKHNIRDLFIRTINN